MLHSAGKELQVAKKRVGKYPKAFRKMALERMQNCASVTALAMELGVDRTVLYHWQRNLDPGEEGTGSTANSPVRKLRKEVREGTPTPPLPRTPSLLGESTR